MALLRLNDFDSRYRATFGSNDIKQFEVYTQQNEAIGGVVDALLDETGWFQYLIVALHPTIANKHVLVPLAQARIDSVAQRVYLHGLSRDQAAELPTYHPAPTAGVPAPAAAAIAAPAPGHPEARQAYHHTAFEASGPLEASAPLETSTPLEGWTVVHQEQSNLTQPSSSEPINSAAAQQEHHVPQDISGKQPFIAPDRPGAPVEVVQEETIRLLDERLVVDRKRRKLGEVVVRKAIETRVIEVPVRRETLIIEQVSPEHKPLASIDLGQERLEGIELRDVVDAESRPVVRGEFSSPRIASQFLQAIADRPNSGCEKVQVTLVLTDPRLQETYLQWLERYSTLHMTQDAALDE